MRTRWLILLFLFMGGALALAQSMPGSPMGADTGGASTGGGGGVTDHGALTGLADDDHPQYLLLTGGTMSGGVGLATDNALDIGSTTEQLRALYTKKISAANSQDISVSSKLVLSSTTGIDVNGRRIFNNGGNGGTVELSDPLCVEAANAYLTSASLCGTAGTTDDGLVWDATALTLAPGAAAAAIDLGTSVLPFDDVFVTTLGASASEVTTAWIDAFNTSGGLHDFNAGLWIQPDSGNNGLQVNHNNGTCMLESTPGNACGRSAHFYAGNNNSTNYIEITNTNDVRAKAVDDLELYTTGGSAGATNALIYANGNLAGDYSVVVGTSGITTAQTDFAVATDVDGTPVYTFKVGSDDGVEVLTNLDLSARVSMTEQTTPGTPATGFGYLWANTADSLLYWTDDGGTAHDLTAGGGGGGDVTKVGTPVDNQLGVWTGDGTIEGDTGLTWDAVTLTVGGDVLPATTSVSDLGSGTQLWDLVRANQIYLTTAVGAAAFTNAPIYANLSVGSSEEMIYMEDSTTGVVMLQCGKTASGASYCNVDGSEPYALRTLGGVDVSDGARFNSIALECEALGTCDVGATGVEFGSAWVQTLDDSDGTIVFGANLVPDVADTLVIGASGNEVGTVWANKIDDADGTVTISALTRISGQVMPSGGIYDDSGGSHFRAANTGITIDPGYATATQTPTTIKDVILLDEQASAPGTPATTTGYLYALSSDSALYWKDDSGTAYDLTASGGVTDHGALTGLADDDHTQYLELDGTDAMTGGLLPTPADTLDLGASGTEWNTAWVQSIEDGDGTVVMGAILQMTDGNLDMNGYSIESSSGPVVVSSSGLQVVGDFQIQSATYVSTTPSALPTCTAALAGSMIYTEDTDSTAFEGSMCLCRKNYAAVSYAWESLNGATCP